MGHVDKTDKLDADELAHLLHNGTLPTVWIPNSELRDERELPRTHIALSKIRTGMKNRIHATLAKHAIDLDEASDSFSGKGLVHLKQTLARLPAETKRCVEQELELLDEIQKHIDKLEERIKQQTKQTHNMKLLKSLPGVGDILAILIEREIGSIDRLFNGEHFASYAGVVPKVKSSGGKTYHGHLEQEANQYLKWAFIEAASVASRFHNSTAWRYKHVVQLYECVWRRKGHGIAIGAVARHLAESAYWMLMKGQTYHEPSQLKKGLPKQG
jgi:transposase